MDIQQVASESSVLHNKLGVWGLRANLYGLEFPLASLHPSYVCLRRNCLHPTMTYVQMASSASDGLRHAVGMRMSRSCNSLAG